jgi:cytoskeletal protein CcmA (bactofilin family)
MHDNLRDLKASGVAKLSGGAYRDVDVSGSAHIDSDIVCENFGASGSVKVAGNVSSDKFRVSGSTRIDGNVSAGEFRASGSASVLGNLDAKDVHASGSIKAEGAITVESELRVSGSASFGGPIRARSVRASGSLKAMKGIECESLTLAGAFDVDGLINAGSADIDLAGQSRLDEIGGERITVRRRGVLSVLGIQLPFGLGGFLTANVIEATAVSLESTRAKVVRGAEVSIGSGCEIDRVEYSKTLDVAEDAIVREKVKVD